MKDNKKIINPAILVFIIVLMVFQVIISNRDSTSGEKLTDVMDKIEQIEEENTKLAEKIASASAIVTISKKIENYGFSSNHNSLSLASPIPFAFSGSSL